RFPSPLQLVEERFSHLGEGLAFYTGRESEGALKRAKKDWDEGKVRLLVLTGATVTGWWTWGTLPPCPRATTSGFCRQP
ncbi:MAG: hypothetical protein N2324_13090, partial [Thermus sp.]|nr:hypothetical protein [Thermus sp.]